MTQEQQNLLFIQGVLYGAGGALLLVSIPYLFGVINPVGFIPFGLGWLLMIAAYVSRYRFKITIREI